MESRREPVARCPHCVELNVLSANFCKHCGHEAHGKKADCQCRRCAPSSAYAVHQLPNGTVLLMEAHPADPDEDWGDAAQQIGFG